MAKKKAAKPIIEDLEAEQLTTEFLESEFTVELSDEEKETGEIEVKGVTENIDPEKRKRQGKFIVLRLIER